MEMQLFGLKWHCGHPDSLTTQTLHLHMDHCDVGFGDEREQSFELLVVIDGFGALPPFSGGGSCGPSSGFLMRNRSAQRRIFESTRKLGRYLPQNDSTE